MMRVGRPKGNLPSSSPAVETVAFSSMTSTCIHLRAYACKHPARRSHRTRDDMQYSFPFTSSANAQRMRDPPADPPPEFARQFPARRVVDTLGAESRGFGAEVRRLES